MLWVSRDPRSPNLSFSWLHDTTIDVVCARTGELRPISGEAIGIPIYSWVNLLTYVLHQHPESSTEDANCRSLLEHYPRPSKNILADLVNKHAIDTSIVTAVKN